MFFIRNLFIRKLGWESQKNKKKIKKKTRVNLTYAQEIRKYLSLKLILAGEIMLKNRKNVPYFGK